MPGLLRRRRVSIPSVLAVLAMITVLAAPGALVACAHEDAGEVVGSSHTAMSAPAERGDAGPGANDPQLPAGWRDSFVQIGTLGASRGHGTGDWPTTVFANEAAARALREHDDAAPGATLVAVHPSKSGELLFVMQKTADAARVAGVTGAAGASGGDGGTGGGQLRWQYRVRDAAGVTRDPPACETCHAQAPRDHLFAVAVDAGR